MANPSKQVKSVAAMLFVLCLTSATDDDKSVDYNDLDFTYSYGMKPEQFQLSSIIGNIQYGYEKANGPLTWERIFPGCRGTRQSPVDIVSPTCHTKHNTAIQWQGYDKKPIQMTITNDGYTVKVKAKWDSECKTPRVKRRNHKEEFVLSELHFHWGENDTVGSEHTINGVRYPLEMHAIHYRHDLGLDKASVTPGGLMVIALLFKLCSQQSSAIGQLAKDFSKVREATSSVDVEPVAMERILPIFSRHYFTYDGSLTAPPCSESVKWVINKRLASVTSEEMRQFRHFTANGKLVKRNYRPTQPLNGRVVLEIK